MAKLKGVDWNILTRSVISRMVLACKDSIVGKKLKETEVYAIMSAHIKQYLPITTRRQYSKSNLSGYVYIGGAYHSDIDQASNRAIKLVFQ